MTYRRLLLATMAAVLAACSEPPTEPVIDEPGSVSVVVDTLRLFSLADSAQLVAHVRSTDGSVMPGAQIRWTSSDENVVRIGASGFARPIAEGQSLVIATIDSTLADTVVVRVNVPGTYKDVTAGRHMTCALANSGRVFCWGRNDFGALGTMASAHVFPETQVDAPVSFVAIDAGAEHVCGLDTTGAAWCWGLNDGAQLGIPGLMCVQPIDNCTGPNLCYAGESPESPSRYSFYQPCYNQAVRVATQERFVAITAGNHHSCALTQEGRAFCWGRSYGVGNMLAPGGAPIEVAGGLRFKQIDAGENYTCGITTVGQAYCWGGNESGQLGDGTTDLQRYPKAVVDGRVYKSISANIPTQATIAVVNKRSWESTTCAVTTDAETFCWGYGGFGELGPLSNPSVVTRPNRVPTLPAKSVSVGGSVVCVVSVDALHCWGTGRVGDGTEHSLRSPVTVGATREFVKVSVGLYHACALTQLGAVYCWGSDLYGELGRGLPFYGPNKPFLLFPVRVKDVQ